MAAMVGSLTVDTPCRGRVEEDTVVDVGLGGVGALRGVGEGVIDVGPNAGLDIGDLPVGQMPVLEQPPAEGGRGVARHGGRELLLRDVAEVGCAGVAGEPV